MRKDLNDKVQELVSYLSIASPQINEQNKLQWYLCGSLSSMALSKGINIKNCQVMEDETITEKETLKISKDSKYVLSLFARKIHDIDVINVDGSFWYNKHYINSKTGNKTSSVSKAAIREYSPDAIDVFENINNNIYDYLENDRIITYHDISKLELENGNSIYIASPPAQIAYKLDELIHLTKNKIFTTEYFEIDKYSKDLKDITTLTLASAMIYTEEELIQRISLSLKNKNESSFLRHRDKLSEIFEDINKNITYFISNSTLYEIEQNNNIYVSNIIDNVYQQNNEIKQRDERSTQSSIKL